MLCGGDVSTGQETSDHAARCGCDSLAQVTSVRLSNQGKQTTAARDAAFAGTLREAPAVVRGKNCAKARRARIIRPLARLGATFAGWDCSRTYDFHPRFACLSRLLKYLGGQLKSRKLSRLQHKPAEKAGVGRFNSVPGHHHAKDLKLFSVLLPWL